MTRPVAHVIFSGSLWVSCFTEIGEGPAPWDFRFDGGQSGGNESIGHLIPPSDLVSAGKLAVPYGSRTRVAAVKEKQCTVIQAFEELREGHVSKHNPTG